MSVPRFTNENINPRFFTGNIGDAFQLFAYELLLRDMPTLHRFPSGGKDGSIDLIRSSNYHRVVECKFVGEDDYATIESRWKGVRKLLEKHLEEATGPTLGQSQYAPWYDVETPIGEYWFCISAELKTQEQRSKLKNSIYNFFQDLAHRRSHLSHLANLKPEVLDWNDLERKVKEQPHLLFRWFPSSRPKGLVPLDDGAETGTFRAYLSNAKLPYYSLAEHLGAILTPNNGVVLDEERLLEELEGSEITGLVISGKGGVGKSRLTLELGRLAVRKGWSVLRVLSRLKEGALEELGERLSPEATVLLLIDYIETQRDFGELVESINVLNDSGVTRIRYVAACRTAYYHKAIVASGRHLPVDLTPPAGDPTLEWFTHYRRQTVLRILADVSLTNSQQHQAVCNDLPILAVFLVYLHNSGRSDELAELLSEIEFGRWVAKRVQLTFSSDVSRQLALLIPLFPMEESAQSQFVEGVYRDVFDRLATDGWVERVGGHAVETRKTWVMAHDVLADQILLSYLRSIPNTVETFIGELLSLAARCDGLRSAIISLQRVSDAAPLSSVAWLRIFGDAITSNELSWRKVRDFLMRSPLLTVTDRLDLLRTHEGLWLGAEQDGGFHKSLGWLIRLVVTKQNETIREEHKNTLASWIARVIPFANRSNFVIVWGLRFAPEIVKTTALDWISNRPTFFQTQYLIAAWLDRGLSADAIAPFVQQWCKRFARTLHFSFTAAAWLNAGGDKGLIEDALRQWPVSHRRNAASRFVYKAWLDAGGEPGLIEEGVKEWLATHRSDRAARFIYTAWLNAGGKPRLVEQEVKEWLVTHRSDADTRFVYKAWLDAGGEMPVMEEDIRAWLVTHRGDPTAQFVYDAWLDAGGEKGLVQEGIKEWLMIHRAEADASHIYKAWLDAGGETRLIEEEIKEWLVFHRSDAEATHVYKAWLDAGGEMEFVKEAIKEWLVIHRSDAEAQFVYKAWLNAGGEKELIETGIKEWLVTHRTNPETQFLYKAWLNAGGEKALVEDGIREWLMTNSCDAQASHVYQAWLDAGGEKALVEDGIKEWLVTHRSDAEAQFVYKAWLNAGGEKELIEEGLKEWLAAYRSDRGAQFIYKAWLDAGGETRLMEEAIKEWLVIHRSNADTQFVYKAWLDAGGERQAVEEEVRAWLATHRSDPAAQFVYDAWLNAGGEKALVEQEIKEWLATHRRHPAAQFVYSAWLNAGGEKHVVQEEIKDWLVSNRAEAEASHVYKAWLNAGGETAFVEEEIEDWLVIHRSDAEAPFVYKAWLDAGGEKGLVEEGIKEWLVTHGSDPEARFVYKAWLDAGGEKALLENGIKDWLLTYRADADASHVYQAWLDAGGEKGFVRAAIADWLTAYSDGVDADHVFRSWLEAGGDRELVWDAAIVWLAKHRSEESAVYVTKFIAKQQNLSENTIRDILIWCRTFPGNVDALWRLTQLGNNLLGSGIAEDLMITSEVVVGYLLQSRVVLENTTRGQITALLTYLIGSPEMRYGPLRERVDSLLVRWLRHPLSFGLNPKPFIALQRPGLPLRVSILLVSGVLSFDRDSGPLTRFMQWLNLWDINRKQEIVPIVEQLKAHYATR